MIKNEEILSINTMKLTNILKKSALTILAAGTLYSCDNISEGIIYEKTIEPERTYMYLMPIAHTISTGKNTTTYFTYIPMWMYDDQDYVIKIKHYNTKKDKMKTRSVYVTPETYNCFNEGDYFAVGDNCIEDQDIKVRKATDTEFKQQATQEDIKKYKNQ